MNTVQVYDGDGVRAGVRPRLGDKVIEFANDHLIVASVFSWGINFRRQTPWSALWNAEIHCCNVEEARVLRRFIHDRRETLGEIQLNGRYGSGRPMCTTIQPKKIVSLCSRLDRVYVGYDDKSE